MTWKEIPELYEVAKRITLDAGFPYFDPRTGERTEPTTMPRKPKDLKRDALAKLAAETVNRYPGSRVHFKFTCQHCGHRCMLSEPNKLYEAGICNACGKETKIDKGGFALFLGGSE